MIILTDAEFMSQKYVRMKAIIKLPIFPFHFHKVHRRPAIYVPGTTLCHDLLFI